MEEYMLPCAVKSLTGYKCITCGMQRAILEIFKGNFSLAYELHPASFTTVLLIVYTMLHIFIKFKNGSRYILILAILNLIISIIQYI